MTPEKYYELRQHYKLVKEADKLVERLKRHEKHHTKPTTTEMIQLIAFKQEAGMMPAEYIERYDNCWKD
ncbi:hypothetical protein [Lactobacillus crispatus]|uniref:hypothetical protein n=1 Tax=Lactobacillus crispatus TaxID=47770 RepID=UPI0023A9E76B|nr:hypothetical protein [Lactobacillus crispatus]WEB33800.1 hypothetical protein PUW44_06115 [Lactobacillus crispatus]